MLASSVLPSNHDQYLLELINRGRADPNAEAIRYGTALNEGLAAGTISSDAKQPLASMEMLKITGAANKADLVRIDFRAGGTFALAEGIVLDGGTGTKADTLLLRGTTGVDTFEDRFTNLETGITDPANPKLGIIKLVRNTMTNPLGTVLDYGVRDAFLGGLGSDWFFDFPNETTDRGPEDR